MYYHSDRQFTIDPNDGKEMLVTITIKDLGDYTKQETHSSSDYYE
jgi:hypothetical protein